MTHVCCRTGISRLIISHDCCFQGALPCRIQENADLLCGLEHAGDTVGAKLKPDGEQAGQGLVDVVVPLLHGHPVIPQHILHVIHKGCVLPNLDPADVFLHI